jgi:hypothetical protein
MWKSPLEMIGVHPAGNERIFQEEVETVHNRNRHFTEISVTPPSKSRSSSKFSAWKQGLG